MPKNGTTWRAQRFMTIDVDIQPEGFNLCCWMSTKEFWQGELKSFPHAYTYSGDDCVWHIHANVELTSKIIVMAGEQADKIIAEQIERNDKRKLSNR